MSSPARTEETRPPNSYFVFRTSNALLNLLQPHNRARKLDRTRISQRHILIFATSKLTLLDFYFDPLCFSDSTSVMADYSFGGTEEENAELKKLNAEVVR